MTPPLYRRLLHLINCLEAQIYEPLYSRREFRRGRWDYVCYSFARFLKHLEEAHAVLGGGKHLKFMDVGCGLGSKVHLAGLFFDSYGLEVNRAYHKVATQVTRDRRFYPHGRSTEGKGDKRCIFRQDALGFDYRPFDVIYFFRPLNKVKMQRDLERRIFETAKEGAIIIPIYSQSKFPAYIHHLRTPSKQLYLKKSDDEQAKQETARVTQLFAG